MEQQPLISVIVPVYKVEPYLEACIVSVLKQTYHQLELVLIDDGSPDGCGAICDRFAGMDSRVRVFHKENGGTGSARNLGLEVCRGEWIAMLDADDELAPDMLATMYSLADEEVDLVECALTKEGFAHRDQNMEAKVWRVDSATAMRAHLRDEAFRQIPGGKLYRTAAIGSLRYPLHVEHEDEFFTYQIIGNSRYLVSTSAVLYYYRQREGSVMNVSFRVSRADPLVAHQQRVAYMGEHFPELVYEARVALLLLCMYLMDGTLAYLKGENRTLVLGKINQAMCTLRPLYPRRGSGFRRNLWVISFQLWPKGTSYLRNLLRRLLGMM